MTDSTLRITIRSDQAEQNARNLARELNAIDRNGVGASRSMDSMSAATRSLAGYMAGILTVGTAINRMDTYTGLNNKLKLVTNSQGELNTALGDTFKIAQNTAQAWESVAQIYQRFSDNAKTLNINQAQTAQLTDTVSKAIAISGGSAQSAEAALIQFSQALASNVLRGEELNSVMEQAPGLAKAIAQGMGITVGQLRSVAAEGKITGDVLVKALTASKESVDNLFSKTDFTISQSLTQLSNEVTKFVGEAGKGSGAANLLSGSITALSQSLSTIANVAAIGGVALLTKTILTQTVAVYGSITASALRRKDMLADLATQATASATEARRTAALAQYTTMQLADAKATAARMTGMQRLAYVQATVIPLEAKATQATAAHSAATASDTIIQNANNAARSRGAMLLALVGGPIGAITLGVTALAAGYMYMSSRTAEANAKLEEQAAVAKKAKDELLALKGLEKDNAVNDMTAAFERQNAALSESSSKINMQLNAIEQLYKGNKEVVQVVQDARNGTISMTEAVQRFNELRISKEVYEAIKANTVEFEKNAKEATNTKTKLSLFGYEVELSGRKAQTAVVGVDENSKSLDKNATAAEEAAKAQAEFKKSLFDREFNAGLTRAMLDQGYNAEQINLISEYALKLQKEGKSITVEQVQYLLKINSIEEQNKKVIESKNAAEKERTKELEKQQKVLTASSKVQANAAKYNFAGLESKYGLPSGTLSAIHAIETGNTGKSNQVNKQSGATGGFQFLEGTAKQYGVKDRTDLAQSAEGAAKYMSYLLKLFKGDLEKAVRAYHAGEGNVQKGKNIGKYNNDYWQKFKGYTAGVNGFTAGDVGSKEWEKLLEEAAKMAEQQAELRKNLELNVADEVTRIRSKLADDLQEIDKAGYSPERAKEIKAEYQARADNDIAIAEYALKTKLDDYSDFQKSESDLLKKSFDEKKFYASQDIELSREQKEKAIQFLDEQYKQELALIELAKEERIFQMQQGLMSANAASEKYWSLERDRVIANSKLTVEEKQKEIELINALQNQEKQTNLNNAIEQWGQTEAEMRGTGDQYQLNKARKDRGDQSAKLADAEFAKLREQEKDPNADMQAIAEKREAIWQAHHDRMTVIETDYQARSIGLQANQAAQFAGIMQGMVSECSTAYAALGAIQKGAALFSTAMNSYTAISAAWASAPFPYNLGAVASATLETGLLQAAVSALSPQGYADGGYTGHGGKYDVAGLVHKGEGVLTQEEIRAVGGEQGFNQLRQAIRSGYADGGLVKDTNRVGIGQLNAVNGASNAQAKQQAQANVVANETRGQSSGQSQVNLNPNFVIVDERENLGDYLFSPDGTKAFVKFFKRNRSALGV